MEAQRKNSRKRQAMLDILCSSFEHPTAEMLYKQLKPMFPELSLGTVYRNLGILAEEGLVTSVAHVKGQERYDARTAPHAHFVCRCCGGVSDLDLPDVVSNMYGGIEDKYGFEAEGYSLSISGICACCRGKQDFDCETQCPQ